MRLVRRVGVPTNEMMKDIYEAVQVRRVAYDEMMMDMHEAAHAHSVGKNA